MFTDDEKDYIMRMIKEIARVLASVMLGKKYVQVELPVESKYQISGDKLHHLKTMVDQGEVNEAENELLERIDYSSKEDLAEAMFFTNMLRPRGMNFWKNIIIHWRRSRKGYSSLHRMPDMEIF